MPPPASRASIVRLLNLTRSSGCLGCGKSHAHHAPHAHAHRGMATPLDADLVGMPAPGDTDYAFEMAASNLRFGSGVTSEVGMDFANMVKQMPKQMQSSAKVGVFTDKTVGGLQPMKVAVRSLEQNGVPYEIFDRVSDGLVLEGMQKLKQDLMGQEAIAFSRSKDFSHFLAVGGGSTIDTAKAANLFTVYHEAELLDFINAPIGKGQPIAKALRPLIAVPTTAGTGSETTGTAILDIPSLSFKTGIASRALKPTLGIVDTMNTATCPREVAVSAGLDVLFHSLESWTAVPYHERGPRPANPINRPAYQGSNPISDIFSKWALEQTIKYLPRILRDPHGDEEARAQMLLASSTAGIGFGNAGVHLCHAASYPISSLNKGRTKDTQYHHPSYSPDVPLIPHGIAVSLTAPAVFRFTAPSSPARHREAAAIFMGKERASELDRVPDHEVGLYLGGEVERFLDSLNVPRGLSKVGYTKSDVDRLVTGMIPQKRVLDLAPVLHDANTDEGKEQLTQIINDAMEW